MTLRRWHPIALDEYLAALPVRRRRVRFRVEGALDVPAFSGALWHAVLGPALKNDVCTVPPGVCEGCLRRAECAYPRVMEHGPDAVSEAPLAGLARIPGPLAFDAAPWRSRHLEAGEDLEVGIAMVDGTGRLMETVTQALARAGQAGLGRRRTPATLEGWTDSSWSDALAGAPAWPTSGAPARPTAGVPVRLRMLTPLRLKRQARFLTRFDPAALARDLSLRIAALGHYHGGLPWPAPWPEIAAEAAAITVPRARLRWVDAPRFSRRQERTVVLGGLLGDVELHGLGPALARVLAAGTVLHAGKGSALGLGQLAIETVMEKESTE